MRFKLMLVAATVAVSSFGQGLLRRETPGLLELRRSSDLAKEFKEKHPEGTNESGRTFEKEKKRMEEQVRTFKRARFLQENPSGKNRFQRSFDEECEFEEAFDLDTFLGFELGKVIGNAKTVKLAKPYRLFDLANLRTTAKGRLYKITLEKSFKDVSFASLSNEIQKLVANIEDTYKVPMSMARTGSSASKLYFFGNYHCEMIPRVGKAAFQVLGNYDHETGRGSISMGVCKPEMYNADREQSKAERRAELEAKQRDVSLPDDAGAELLTSKVSNVTEFNDKKTDSVDMLLNTVNEYTMRDTPFLRNGNTRTGTAGNEIVVPILIPMMREGGVRPRNANNPWDPDRLSGGVVGFVPTNFCLAFLRFSDSGLLLGISPTLDGSSPSVRAPFPPPPTP